MKKVENFKVESVLHEIQIQVVKAEGQAEPIILLVNKANLPVATMNVMLGVATMVCTELQNRQTKMN